MCEITKPMLAATVEDITKLTYPLAASFKLDGIRALRLEAGLVSRSLKQIANKHINAMLTLALPVGIDGEIMSGSNFQQVTTAVMTQDSVSDFYYNAFDYVKDGIKKPYMDRIEDLKEWYKNNEKPYIKLVLPEIVNNVDELLAFEDKSLSLGYEGVILRSLNSPYKNGRSTLREGYLSKLKRFLDSEAVVIGFEELMVNNNEPTINELGLQERSSHQGNLIPGATLGALEVMDIKTSVTFKIGTGFDAETRLAIWKDRDTYLNQLVKYKYFPISQKDKPRHPVFLGFRSREDMTQ